MNVTREVILDLLPVYLAGEASLATRVLVEEFLQQDPELGRDVRRQMVESLAAVAPPLLPPDLELSALRRTRRLIFWQRRLFGLAILFSLLPLSSAFKFENGRLTEAYFLARDYPQMAVLSLILAISLWTVYYVNRRRLRTAL